ncbi:MAG: pyridoxal-phosphate dependent enzyme [Thermomicrobiales bacterium]|nr:pyridoxal-phosphate dependent enzyme [Thermomicrobiales bacterium]
MSCERCATKIDASRDAWRCAVCGGPLRWETERRFGRAAIDPGATGLWRYVASLPIGHDATASFNETITPLVDVDLAGRRVACKLDFLLPSGRYKDRGAAVLIPALRRLGATHAVEDSSGNAAAAIAAYAARAGIRCTVYAPAAASPGKLVQAAAYGAEVVRVEGSRDDVATAAMDAAARTPGATYASHNWHPFFIEGVKTWAFEVWEQSGFRAPDAVVAPAGSGSMILGAHLAFGALLAAGEIARMPRIYAAQPSACAPIVAALDRGELDAMPFARRPTLAEGASIANPVRGRELLAAIRSSGGGAVAVDEGEIESGLREIAAAGIYIEPTSALAVAATRRLIASGALRADERVVMVLSGSGLKATEAIGRLVANER